MSPVSEEGEGPVIALVVAMAENGAIGKDGGLPWRLSSDMRFFRKVTLGKPVIMGRKTFASLGRLLDQRFNIVLSREPGYRVPGAAVAQSVPEALELARGAAAAAGMDEFMVIGGEDVFREVLPAARRLYLTEVHAALEGDTWFPDFDRSQWREVSRERHEPGPKDDHPFSFVLLERV